MSKKVWIVVIVLAVASSAAGLVLHHRKDAIARRLTEQLILDATGLHVEIGRIETRLFKLAVQIEDMRLLNPEEFVEREAFLIPHVYAQATLRTFLGLDQHLEKLHVRIDDITVVRNADGVSNLDRIIGELPQVRHVPAPGWLVSALQPAVVGPTSWPRQAGGVALPEPTALVIDEFKIRIGSVHLVDYTMGANGKPMTVDYTLDEERVFQDVTDLEQVMGNMMMSLVLDALPRNLDAVLPQVVDQLDEVAPELMQELRDFLGRPGDDSDGGEAKADDPVDAVKELMKSFLE